MTFVDQNGNHEPQRPTVESFIAKLLAAHAAFEAGDVAPLDAEEIKRRARERMSASNAIDDEPPTGER